ncbi:DNA cytosine methyltransferase [Methylobacterium sp. P5_C11]
MDMPLPAITAGGTHLGLAQPVLIKQNFRRDVQGVDDPAPTVMTQARLGLAEPVIVNMKGQSTATAVDEPLPTQTAHAGHLYAAEPFVMATGSTGVPRVTADPLPTITTGGAGSEDPGCARPMLIEPLVLSRHAEGAARPVSQPTPTQVAKHSHLLISPYYSSGSGETCASGEDPLPTATAKARFGMVVPITHADGGNRARDAAVDPLPTITTAHRGELAFIAAQFGEREGQAPRVHDIADPAPTLCATGRVNLVEGTETYDILFRMLEPHELAAAMGFNDEERRYEFTGTKTEQIKQIGNAVSVAKMTACVAAIMADAAPKTREESGPFLEAVA